MSSNFSLSHNYRLEKLRKWLNFEIPGGVLFGLSFFYHTAFLILFAAALIFTPYMLYVLFQDRRYGWLVSFGAFVVIPAFICYYLLGGFPTPGYFFTAGRQILASSVPIVFFFFYCFVLKLSIPGMLDE